MASTSQASLPVTVNPHKFLKKTKAFSFIGSRTANPHSGHTAISCTQLSLTSLRLLHFLVRMGRDHSFKAKLQHLNYAPALSPYTPSSQWITSKKCLHSTNMRERSMTLLNKEHTEANLISFNYLCSLSIPWTETYSLGFSSAAFYLEHIIVTEVPVLAVWKTMEFPAILRKG